MSASRSNLVNPVSKWEIPQRLVAIKAYGWDWMNKFGLSMREGADSLHQNGCDWVLVENRIDPRVIRLHDDGGPQQKFDDRTWTAELQNRGLRVLQTTAMFFDAAAYANNLELRPVNQRGETAPEVGWYRGINPTDERYLSWKIDKICSMVEKTKPDGLFVSFFRFPGFWELWLPSSDGFAGTSRSAIDDYGYDRQSIELFEECLGYEIDERDLESKRRAISHELRQEWVAWKCNTIYEIAQRLRREVRSVKPDIELMLNGFGLCDEHFDNAVKEVLGQDLRLLSSRYENFELMFYFQIQKRDPAVWIPKRLAEIEHDLSELDHKPTVLVDLQAGAEYLDPIYKEGERAQRISRFEWRAALQATAATSANGVLVYSWRHLLTDTASNGGFTRDLLAYKNGDFEAA